MDLLSPRAAVAKHYAGLASTTDIYLAYPRRLVLTELKHAVENLRTMTTQDAMWIGTQYCWVDLTQRFEVAHTQNRQDRCENLHKANGAVYMETVLRNIAWSDLRGYYGQSDGIFGMVVLDWLLQVDFQVVCTTGDLAIGQPVRFVLLIAIVLVSKCGVLCHHTLPCDEYPENPTQVCVLVRRSQVHAYNGGWISDDMYFMDRISAAMNGILTVRRGSVMYGLDTKLWCTLQVDLADTMPHIRAAEFALPLHLSNEY
ncbi:hypothetical protein DYB25_004290 [Aphanomyces astaci]|uniref:Uncharacterized protein n=1 Tax=Aphanomyces astaci TaxID=112090 RepID=A0A397BG47_APHAT|nr:hypothetical protein DYB25_004290 [Aphanomyces astaci]